MSLISLLAFKDYFHFSLYISNPSYLHLLQCLHYESHWLQHCQQKTVPYLKMNPWLNTWLFPKTKASSLWSDSVCLPLLNMGNWKPVGLELCGILIVLTSVLCLPSAAWTWAVRSWGCRAATRSCPSSARCLTTSANTTPTRTCEPDSAGGTTSCHLWAAAAAWLDGCCPSLDCPITVSLTLPEHGWALASVALSVYIIVFVESRHWLWLSQLY